MKLDYIGLGVSAPNYPPLNNDTAYVAVVLFIWKVM